MAAREIFNFSNSYEASVGNCVRLTDNISVSVNSATKRREAKDYSSGNKNRLRPWDWISLGIVPS